MKSFARTLLTTSAVILAVILVLAPGWGKPVDYKEALEVADAWLAANPAPMVSNPNGKVWKTKGVRPFLGYSGETLAYIVDLRPQGFIVVPADDEVEPIITFGTEGDFPGTLGPEDILADLLASDIPSRLRNKDRMPLEYRDKVAERWSTARKAALQTDGEHVIVGTVSPVVNPLITDTWNQGGDSAPFTYNYYCPNHYITGCVATAMGMIIHYYRYPASASCTNTIYLAGTPTVVSFNDTFNYDLMPTSISGGSPLANIQEVAKLLYDCGVSVNMQYNTAANGGSGAYISQVATALVNTFQYLTASWKNGSDSDWASVLKNDLNAGFPAELAIRSTSSGAGHAIVCDGWGTESGADRFHLNMGWGGYANNWYAVPGFTAGGYTWDQLSGYIYNIRKSMPVSTPTFSPDGGTYNAAQSVVIACTTQDAVIHYTTNGVDPTENDPVVSAPVLVDSDLTLKAKAWKTGLAASSVKSAAYSFQTGTPVFDPVGGAVSSALNVSVTCATPGAEIHYTTNGVDPTTNDPIAVGSAFVGRNLTLKAKAWKSGWAASLIRSADFTITPLSSMKKLANTLGATISKAIVTAAPSTSMFYVEADDRSCGVLVYKSGYKATVGKRVTVQGNMGTASNGEKWITATSITNAGTGTVDPLMLSNRDVGGSDWCYYASTGAGQKGVKYNTDPYSYTLNNIGMLITTAGTVTYSTSGYFYIDDGSKLADNSGQTGVKVLGSVPEPTPLPPGWTPVGKPVIVTGISSCFKATSDLYRQISATQVVLVQ